MVPMDRKKRTGGEQPAQEPRKKSEIPLTPAVFEILLSLVEGDKHGYAIMKEVSLRTGGQLRLGPGTLYGCIQRMTAAGLIRECDDVPAAADELERRRYYSLTPYGKQMAASEARRMSRLVRLAYKLRLIPGTNL